MEQRNIEFPFLGRYIQSAEVTNSTRDVWFVLHGYGQLSTFFSKKFAVVADRGAVIVVPEGLHRFYLEDVEHRASGLPSRVGASWMTREERLTDIANYLNYLHAIYRQVVPAGFLGCVTILGFSQGAATAARWAVSNEIRFNRLILWAGIFPDDLDFDAAHGVLANKQTVMVRGTADPFITPERLAQSQKILDQLKIQPTELLFEGGHEINSAVLQKLMANTMVVSSF